MWLHYSSAFHQGCEALSTQVNGPREPGRAAPFVLPRPYLRGASTSGAVRAEPDPSGAANLSNSLFKFVATLQTNARLGLQDEIRKQLGLSGRREVREVEGHALTIKNPGAAGLTPEPKALIFDSPRLGGLDFRLNFARVDNGEARRPNRMREPQ